MGAFNPIPQGKTKAQKRAEREAEALEQQREKARVEEERTEKKQKAARDRNAKGQTGRRQLLGFLLSTGRSLLKGGSEGGGSSA